MLHHQYLLKLIQCLCATQQAMLGIRELTNPNKQSLKTQLNQF